jgi:hypothetical protein
METKKSSMFSEWSIERCSELTPKNLCYGGGLEDPLPSCTDARARAQARKAEVLSKTTWKMGVLAGELKDELFAFLMKTGGNFEMSQVPSHLTHLVATTEEVSPMQA